MRFYRGNFTQVAIALQTNEALGLLQTDYIEDLDRNDGQLSIVSADGVRRSFLVSVINNELSGSLIQGRVNLSLLADGFYNLQGYIKDTIGNFTAINQQIEIKGGYAFVPVINKAATISASDYTKTTRIPKDVAAQRLRISSGDRDRLKLDRLYRSMG